ncbi:MAG: flagellin-like protein, partial [Acidobacteria bacterium]|nr:flagellin-like protein [Acidobacteriota bacterium]
MGSFSILNNISGLNAQNALNVNNVDLSRTLLRLSSGKRINSGADDAAGLQIADSLRANVYALNQAIRNANDGIGVAQIADGALQEISNLLIRSVTLAEEAATEAVDDTGRASLQAEFDAIQAEIARIATQT